MMKTEQPDGWKKQIETGRIACLRGERKIDAIHPSSLNL